MNTRRRALLSAVLLVGLTPSMLHAAPSVAAPQPPELSVGDVDAGEVIPPENLQPIDDGAPVLQPEAVPEIPDLPAQQQSGENMEPDITIKKDGEDTIQEYRIDGKLYKIKVIPAVGPPYYLLDTDGDGNMDVRRSDLDHGIQTQQWLLFSW